MTPPAVRRFLVLSSLLCLYAANALATWNPIAHLPLPVTCGFFFDEKVGLVGCGNGANTFPSTTAIFKTHDGGLTWTPCMIPITNGNISSIFMYDSLVGYASVMNSLYPIWRTTDGGVGWEYFDTTDNIGNGTCVFATPSAIIKTVWNEAGGPIFSGGIDSAVFHGFNSDGSNGIDFLDDLIGVVTMGPDVTFGTTRSYTYRTNDGGKTWLQGGDMKEAWGVYAQKESGIFYALAEDAPSADGNVLYMSPDNGITWHPRDSVGVPAHLKFTGHIAGAASAIYVQTSDSSHIGLFRSDDRGATWRNVGGPSNHRDTRFNVIGCTGSVVYAYDTIGTIWKTTDGGDGTLSSSQESANIYLKTSTVTASAGDTIDIPLYITGTPGVITLANGTALDVPFTLDLTMGKPVAFKSAMPGIQIAGGIDTSNGIATVHLQAPAGATINGETIIGTLRCVLSLSDTLEATISIPFGSTIGSSNTSCLALTADTGTVHIVLAGCGYLTLLNFMRTGQAFSIESITPNPATNKVCIQLSSDLRHSVAYEIVDAIGTTRKHGVMTDPAVTLDVESLSRGVYFFRVVTGGGSVVSKEFAIVR